MSREDVALPRQRTQYTFEFEAEEKAGGLET